MQLRYHSVIRIYSYLILHVKSWLLLSLFDFLFHLWSINRVRITIHPQRNPSLPASKFYIDKPFKVPVMVEQYKGQSYRDINNRTNVMLPPALFQSQFATSQATHKLGRGGGVPHPPGLFARLFSRIGGVDTTRYDPLRDELSITSESSNKASLEHQCVYYSTSVKGAIYFRSTSQLAMANLWPCLSSTRVHGGIVTGLAIGWFDALLLRTAGDIRIHYYQVQDPSEISVLAQVVSQTLGVNNDVDVDVGVGLQLRAAYTSNETPTKVALVCPRGRPLGVGNDACCYTHWPLVEVLYMDLPRRAGAANLLSVSVSPASVASGILGATWMMIWGISSQFARDVDCVWWHVWPLELWSWKMLLDLWQNQQILIVWISWKVNIMSMKEIVFRDLRRGFGMRVLPIKYPTDFPFGCQ
jgi:hypothetical protein